MEKSDKIPYYEDANPSAPPVHRLSAHQQSDFLPGAHQQPSYFQDVNQQPGFMPHPQKPIGPPHVADDVDYCQRLHSNRRQTGSIAGGLLLMLVSGLHIGWGIWRTGNFYGWWLAGIRTEGVLIFTLMAWPLGALIGGFIGSALTPLLKKNIIYYITASMMVFGNLIYIIWDEHHEAAITGRLMISVAHGIAFVTIITHAGENAAKNMRGTILSTINIMIYTSIFISVIILGTIRLTWFYVPATISMERMIGIMGLIFALASIVCTIMLTVETVPYLLIWNQPNDAMANMKHLRDVSSETAQITSEMEELNLMIIQDKQDSRNIFTRSNRKPLVLMIIARLLVSLTNNLLLNTLFISFAQLIIDNYRYAAMLIVGPRLAMSVIQIFYADYFGRRTQIIVSSTLSGAILILLGILLNTMSSSNFYYVPAILSIIFQMFCSMGLDQMPDVYLSEAFSTSKKPWSIPFATEFEHLFHIFMIGMGFTILTHVAQINALMFGTGTAIIVFGWILYFTLPETRGATLKQARDLFRNEKLFNEINFGSRRF